MSPTSHDATDPPYVASAAARRLGHTPLRSRNAYECWMCAATGVVDVDAAMAGSIFTEQCR